MTPNHRVHSLLVVAGLLVPLAGPDTASAVTISGTVRNEAGAGLGNVDIDLISLCSGDNVFLVGDKTAADGTYNIVVPTGNFDIHLTPPAGSTVAAADLQSRLITADANLGITTLHPGRLVSGTVLTPSLGPAAGVDLKFVDRTTNRRVYFSKDVTNSTGQYSVRVTPGTWDIDFRPPLSTSYTDQERLGLSVGTSDISGLVDVLGSGFTITGTIQDWNGVRLKNVDIDVFDQCTGRRVATAHDNTDANGLYSVCVPAGTYTFEYNPPTCMAVQAARSSNTIVGGSRDLGTEQLGPAVLVSGLVRDDMGLPLADAKIKFYDVANGGATRQAAAHDHTDASGNFNIYVPTGLYDIIIEPPVGKFDQVGRLAGVAVAGTANIGTVQLLAGMAVSGHLAGPGNLPAVNVNINAVDSATRAAQRLAHDATDSSGNFTVVVAPGTYDFQYDPPACSGLAPASQNHMSISGPTALPALGLVTGVHALGSVFDTHGLPVPSVDLDFYPSGSTTKWYTPGDRTASDGTYDVLVAPGTYDIKYIPPSGTRLRPTANLATSLASTRTLPTTVLADGWLVSGLVLDGTTLAPVAGVTVDFYAPNVPIPAWTVHHVTGADGRYSIAVDAGSWDLRYTPIQGAPYAKAWRPGVVVSADVQLSAQLLLPGTTATGLVLPPTGLTLTNPWPNPAHGHLNVAFSAPNRDVELSAWDVAGHRVATLWRGRPTSTVRVQWDGLRTDGRPLSAGIYFVRLADRNGGSVVHRITWIR